MAKNSSIEWTHHTFNPWWGCTKVSPACDHCYAEAWAKRVGCSIWGAKSPRRYFGDSHWSEPLRWNREATEFQQRKRVFCASMADVFESRSDLTPHRKRLWALIEATPNLDWLLLTKRPWNIKKYAPWGKNWPRNVWLGTTVENQKWADLRLPHLLEHPATYRFLSCEPLLGNIDLGTMATHRQFRIDWVIAGGESGPGARPMHPDWVRDLRDQCADLDIAFHFKQWGHWAPVSNSSNKRAMSVKASDERAVFLEPLGKKKAGRILDGVTWDEVPVA